MRTEIIASGKNNLVSKIFYKNKIYIYKKYLKKSNSAIKYSRYSSETSFIKLLRKKNIKNLPSIFATDSKNQENIFNYINGKKVTKVTKNDISQCIKFIKKINQNTFKKNYINFKMATESCVSIEEHIQTANKRIIMLSKFPKNYGVYKDAKEFVKVKLKKKLNDVQKTILNTFSKTEINKKLRKKDLILSPSDFGFHNTIKKNKKLYFFDFEYAGMDDPVKLISDFICQPDCQLSKKHISFFYKNIMKIFPQNLEIKRRLKAVIYIHRIKWCCVIMSEILNTKYLERRQFAGSSVNVKKCFNKAQTYYNRYLKKADFTNFSY
jgi:thiamine kinase-like enzyme